MTSLVSNQSLHKNRISEVDVAKGIGIILVVYAHIVLAEPLLTIIYAFHMPLFFMLSGMVTKVNKYESFGKLVKNKAKTLLIPYLFFCLVGVAFVVATNVVPLVFKHQPWADCGVFFRKVLISVFWAPYSLKYFTAFNTPLWFVPCLFLVEVLYYAINRICKGKRPFILLVVFFVTVLGWVTEYPDWSERFAVLPFNFSSACFSIGFFAIGECVYPLLCSELFSGNNRKKETIIGLCGFVVGAIVTIVIALYNGKVSIGSRILNNGFLLYITGIAGTVCVICLAHIIKWSKFLRFLGRNSFTVMGIHIVIYRSVPYFVSAAGKIGLGFIPDAIKAYGKTAWQLLGFAVSLLLSIIFVLLYNYVLNKRRNNNGRTA